MQTAMLESPQDAGEAVWSSPTMRRSDLVQHKEKEKGTVTRTSQIVFGERQHLLRVLDSLEGTDVPIARRQQERRILEELIHARTRELNQINVAWDEKIGLVLSSDAKPEMLEKLAKQAPPEDFYLLRLISEHPRANAKTLGKLASLWRDSRKRRAPSECGRAHARVAEPRPQSAAVVPRSVQSQHAAVSAAPPARPPETPRGKPSLEITLRFSIRTLCMAQGRPPFCTSIASTSLRDL